MFQVKVTPVPGSPSFFTFNEPTSVKNCAARANVTDYSKYTPLIGGTEVGWDDVINQDTTLSLVPKGKIKGN